MTRFFAVLNLLGLVAGIIGSFFWYYSLTIKPSSYTAVKPISGEAVGICIDGQLITSGYGGALVVSKDDPCPKGADGDKGQLLQVASEHPFMSAWAMRLIGIGFLFQVPSALMTILRS